MGKKLLPRLKHWLLWGVLAGGLALLIFMPSQVTDAVVDSLRLCANVVIPSLFPFFVLSSLIVGTGLARAVGTLLEGLMRPLFRVPGCCGGAFFLGLLSGYPVGAQTAVSLYQNGSCSKDEAERLLAFCNNSGPAFILGSVGIGIFHSARVGWLLYGCHVLAALSVGFVLRFTARSSAASAGAGKPAPLQPFSRVFVDSVKGAVLNMLNVCGFVVFFAILIALLSTLGVFPALGSWLSSLLRFTGQPAAFFETLLSGFLEITSGAKLIGASPLPLPVQIWQCAAILGWAGLSVHCQVLSLLTGTGLSPRRYFLGKLLQSGLSLCFALLALRLFPSATAVFQDSAQTVPTLGASFSQTLFSSLQWVVMAIVGIVFLLLLKNLLRRGRSLSGKSV